MRDFEYMHERMMEAERAPGSVGMVLGSFVGRAIITAWHKEHVGQMLGKGSEEHFCKVQGFSPEFDAISNKSILVVEGQQWKEQRKVLGPAFHFDHVAGLAPYFNRVATNLVARWEEFAKESKPLQVNGWLSKATMDAIGLGGFGFDFDSLSPSGQKREGMAYERLMQEMVNPLRLFRWYQKLPIQANRDFSNTMSQYVEFLEDIIKEKRKNPCTTPGKMDVLDLMVLAADEHSVRPLTDEELVHNVNVFFIAGHETSAATLGFAFHMLAQHPELQDRVAAEVREHCGEGEPDVEAVKKLEYTRWFLSETLRLYGPASAVVREARHDMEFGGYHLSKGDLVMVMSHTLHRMPQYWENPLEFNPERFSPEHSRGRLFTYMPFSVGPRQCIGNNFAMMEMRILLARCVQRFRFKPDPNSKVPFRCETGLVMQAPVELTLLVEPRT
eukprot:TRINITY_DN1941_c0_g1_i2.p1 TRINITY_DN1941_c0_g1~~TRINITY_DN1941_c0_g1_i2.p1  ORF type:complete len:498 (-),score=131.15 TRINITY_DN1941_c0_g1_i2:124-1452(-)